MTAKKKKKSIIPIIFFGIVVIILAYYSAGAWFEGANAFSWYANLTNNVIKNLWVNYYNQYTFIFIGAYLFIYGVIVLYYLAGQGNFMHGKEMGTAKFADPKSINKILSTKDYDVNAKHIIVIYKTIYPFYIKAFLFIKNKCIDLFTRKDK